MGVKRAILPAATSEWYLCVLPSTKVWGQVALGDPYDNSSYRDRLRSKNRIWLILFLGFFMQKKTKKVRAVKKAGVAKKANGSGKSGLGKIHLRLYIAGETPRSVAAMANLKRVCESICWWKDWLSLRLNPSILWLLFIKPKSFHI